MSEATVVEGEDVEVIRGGGGEDTVAVWTPAGGEGSGGAVQADDEPCVGVVTHQLERQPRCDVVRKALGLGQQLVPVATVGTEGEDVPGVQGFAISGGDEEGCGLVGWKAEGFGDVEVFTPGEGDAVEVEGVGLEAGEEDNEEEGGEIEGWRENDSEEGDLEEGFRDRGYHGGVAMGFSDVRG